ncbi:hypothetical protein SFR_2739 [Streptomyces sp. FR-008]|nr:hypothetical protein SFR_2739 [Streptomyces sp. FR-008]
MRDEELLVHDDRHLRQERQRRNGPDHTPGEPLGQLRRREPALPAAHRRHDPLQLRTPVPRQHSEHTRRLDPLHPAHQRLGPLRHTRPPHRRHLQRPPLGSMLDHAVRGLLTVEKRGDLLERGQLGAPGA